MDMFCVLRRNNQPPISSLGPKFHFVALQPKDKILNSSRYLQNSQLFIAQSPFRRSTAEL